MLRDFRPEDQEAVRGLVLAGMRERWGDAFDPDANPDLDDVWTNYVTAGADVVVSQESDGTIVGTGILRPEPGSRGSILRVSVDGRRRRRGVGRQVVDELISRARSRRMVEVVVLADTPWTSAVGLYRACGFTELSSDEVETRFAMSLVE